MSWWSDNVTKPVSKTVKSVGRKIGWKKWGPTALAGLGGAALGALTGGLGAAGLGGLFSAAGGTATGASIAGAAGTAAAVGGAAGLGAGVQGATAHQAAKSAQEAADKEAAAMEKAAAMTKSQPTANASLVAGAAAEQSANRGATDEGVYNANKRRRTLQSTTRRNNVLGTSGGMMGRATLG